MVLEDRGWRMMFPAQPTLEETETLPSGNTGRGERGVADILGGSVYRLARVEQTLILTSHGCDSA
jgi:hypothetical protein